MSKSFKSITSTDIGLEHDETIESFSNQINSLNVSIDSSNYHASYSTTNNKSDCHEKTEIKSPKDVKVDNQHQTSSSKLSKLNRSISSSILSINKFKRKKASRQSIHCDQILGGDSQLPTNGSITVSRKSLTSKNLLKQIENLTEQAGN